MTSVDPQAIPDATVARLPIYLRVLQDLEGDQLATISSEGLAELAGVSASKVRKDLSFFGSYGIRGVGYDVEMLILEIRRDLGLTHDWPCLIAGLGNLGRALATHGGFKERGFTVAALVDTDPAKVGTNLGGITIEHLRELPALVEHHGVCIGIIATPGSEAQGVADTMVAAGIGSILNFAPSVLCVPSSVLVRQVDLAVEFQVLAFYSERRSQQLESSA